jgi:hypothetical protein
MNKLLFKTASNREFEISQLVVFKDHYRGREDFVMLYQKGAQHLAEMRLNGEDWTVLAWLYSVLDYDQKCFMDAPLMKAHVGISRNNALRSIRKLIAGDVIREVGMNGKNQMYQFDPRIVWRGDQLRRDRLVKQLELDLLNVDVAS